MNRCAAKACLNGTPYTWCPTHQPRDHEDDRKPRDERTSR